MKSIIVLASGFGSNLQQIINSINDGYLKNVYIKLIICNKDCQSINRGIKNNINTIFLKWNRKKQSRDSYDIDLANLLNFYNCDLVVLAGWNFILGRNFFYHIKNKNIINLHPALPNTFPGNNAIEDAYNQFMENKIKYTGSMVHKVTPIVDVGEIINTCKIPIFKTDLLNDLKKEYNYMKKRYLWIQ